jgi:hypothetical protein
VTRQGRPASGLVAVRLSGLPADVGALAAVLAGIPAVQILTGPDGPYPNRRSPGHRLYLTLRLTQPPRRPSTTETTHASPGGPSSTGATLYPSDRPHEKEAPMSTEPTYDASNVHLAQGQTAATVQFLAAADTGPETAGPDAPIPYTLTPNADAYLDALHAELSPAEPEPEASL